MKNKCIVFGAIAVFIIGTFWFASCRTADSPQETDRQSLSAPTPIAITASPPSPAGFGDRLWLLEDAANTPVELDAVAAAPTPIAVTPTPSPTKAPTRVPATPALLQHAVRRGDTLLGLARQYGVSMAAIQLANGMGNSNGLIAGQTLSIPSGAQWLEESLFWIVHVVRPGETLVGLSSTYGLMVDDILRVNAIADPALIQVDQQLVVPVAQLVTASGQQATATPAPVAAAPAAERAQAVARQDNTRASSPDTVSAAGASEPPPAKTPPSAATPPASPAGPADWPAYILARINQARADHGLNTLSLVPELSRAAQAHAEDCVQRGWGSHVGSDGAVLRTRLERAGYIGRNVGENWVQARTAERAFDWWYGEIPPKDPHRRNILGSGYTEIGIGVARTRSGYTFVTDFGRR